MPYCSEQYGLYCVNTGSVMKAPYANIWILRCVACWLLLAAALPMSYGSLPEAVLRGVVAIPHPPDADDGSKDDWAIGSSAVVLDDQGTLLTLAEALPKGDGPFRVIIPGAPNAQAKIIQRGSQSSAVLLRIHDAQAIASPLQPLSIGNSDQAEIGTAAWSIGNAFNAIQLDGQASASRGIISGRYSIPEGPPVRGRGGVILSDYRGPVLEVTAAVNDGNQGGALVDSNGALLGLVSLGMGRERKVGTAIPIHHLLADVQWEHSTTNQAPDIDPDYASFTRVAEQVAESMVMVYFHRPDGPGNPRRLRAPPPMTDDLSPYRRQQLQQRWDLYYHFQQVYYTDQPVTAVVLDASEGILLTALSNLHGNAREGVINDPRLGNEDIPVSVIGIDLAMDLAMLQVERPLPLPETPFNWQPDVTTGEPIAVLGRHRDGGDYTMTEGIISAVARTPPGSRVPFLQVDALTNYGNLGGPVIAADGAVIGLITLMGPRAPWLINSGVGIASDSASIARALSPMRHLGGDLGRPRPGLGVLVDDDMRVLRVVPDSGADVAGVETGDILLAIDGASMDDLYDLRGLLAGRAIGDQLSLRLRREDEELDIDVTLGELQ